MKVLKTTSFHEVKRSWYAIDAADMRVGRLATQIAILLQGKHKPHFTPHVDHGDYIVVYNCDKLVCTTQDKIYYRHSGRIGSLKQRTFDEQMALSSEHVLKLAVQRMLKRSPLGRAMIKKLKLFSKDHNCVAQKPKLLNLNSNKYIAEVVYGSND